MTLELERTVDDVLKKIEDISDRHLNFQQVKHFEIVELIEILAMEVKLMKKQLAEHKLLIEHEEAMRTAKSMKHINKILGTPLFRRGDTVYRLKDNKGPGTIRRLSGNRALVEFGDESTWLSIRSIAHWTRTEVA